MSTYVFIIATLLALGTAYLTMPFAIKLAHKVGAVDKPNNRKVHKTIMPRLGGLAIFLGFLISMIFVVKITGPFIGLIIGAIIICFVGILDDIYQLSPFLKLIGQIIAASVAIYYGVVVSFVTNPFDGLLNLGYLSIPITLLWIVGITNAVNLIDGLDGLAAGVSAIAAATMGVVALVQGQQTVALAAFVLVAAILGFIPYNFHPAKTFMGDGGSNFLGFILACLAIMGLAKSAAIISLFIPIVILGIPIFDTFFAIIRRINNKAPIFQPDKAHLHHRLMVLGLSHRESVLAIYAISGFFGMTAITLSLINSPKASLVLAILLLAIVIGAEKLGMVKGDTKSVKQTAEVRDVHAN